MKIVLAISALLIYAQSGVAKTLSCPISLMQATSDFEDHPDKAIKSQQVDIEILESGENKGTGETTVDIETQDGKKITLLLLVRNDDRVNGIYQMTIMTRVNGVHDSIRSLLLIDRGTSTGKPFSLGPKGSTEYKFLYGDTLDERPVDAQMLKSVFEVLKQKKYGIKRSREDANTDPWYRAAKKAIKAKQLTEGQAIGTLLGAEYTFGCWIEK